MKALEIEACGPHCESMRFKPLNRMVRGEFDFNKVCEPMARMEAAKWPSGPVPGQRLGIDEEGVGYIEEPLHKPEFAVLKERLEKKGLKLEPELQTWTDVDQATWLYWLRRAVEAGIARLTKGTLPVKIEGKPRTRFTLNDPKPTAVDRLTESLDRQSRLMAQLLEKLSK